MIKISIVIPCFNSKNSIQKLVEEIVKTIKNTDYYLEEIILINDNSSDETLNIIKKLQSIHNKIIIHNNPINLGQEKATLIGIQYCKGDFIVTIDDDFQNPPLEILKLLEVCIKEDLDFVSGVWKFDESLIRNISSILGSLFLNITSLIKLNYRHTSFRVLNKKIKTKVIEKFYDKNFINLPKLTSNYKQISVEHISKPIGREYTSFSRRFKFFNTFVKNDTYLYEFMILFTLIIIFFKT